MIRAGRINTRRPALDQGFGAVVKTHCPLEAPLCPPAMGRGGPTFLLRFTFSNVPSPDGCLGEKALLASKTVDYGAYLSSHQLFNPVRPLSP